MQPRSIRHSLESSHKTRRRCSKKWKLLSLNSWTDYFAETSTQRETGMMTAMHVNLEWELSNREHKQILMQTKMLLDSAVTQDCKCLFQTPVLTQRRPEKKSTFAWPLLFMATKRTDLWLQQNYHRNFISAWTPSGTFIIDHIGCSYQPFHKSKKVPNTPANCDAAVWGRVFTSELLSQRDWSSSSCFWTCHTLSPISSSRF